MKSTTLTIFCITAFINIYSQDKIVKELQIAGTRPIQSLDSNGWKFSGAFLLNLNQSVLNNWASGGEKSVLGANAIFNYTVNFRHGRNTWDNYFDLALGFQNATSFGKFRKIDDRIDITSKIGHQVNPYWYIGALSNFNSQSLPGYEYTAKGEEKISSFLTPGKITLSAGLDYKTNKRFSLFTSPVTIRWILKEDPDFYTVSKFGIDSASISNIEVGSFVTAKFSAAFTKWASYRGRIDLFSNYKRNPENVDVLMNNLLTMKFTKVLATNISLDLVYDDDIKKRLQLKEILGVGLTVRL